MANARAGGLRRPGEIYRPGDPAARHRQFQGRASRREGRRSLHAGGRAVERAAGSQGRILQERGGLAGGGHRSDARSNTRRSSTPVASCRSTTRGWPTAYDRMVPPGTSRTIAAGCEIRSKRSTTRSRAFPRIACAITSAGEAGPAARHATSPLKDIVDLILKVRAGAYVIEMANPRHEHEWQVWKNVKLPTARMLIPGVISHADQRGRASRAGRRAHRCGSPSWSAARTSSPAPIAASPRARSIAACILDHVGEVRGAGRRRAAREQAVVELREIVMRRYARA